MMNSFGITIGLAALACTALSAQTATSMDKKVDPAKLGTEMSLTGCVEGSKASGAFMLTHAMAPMAKDAVANEQRPAMAKDAMPSGHEGEKVNLIGKEVDFTKHVGHKVTVKGMKDGDAFTAKSVTMVATTCE
jgi:hypothetical protein